MSDNIETRLDVRNLVAHGNCRNVGSSCKKGKWNPENEGHVEMRDLPDGDETKGRTFKCDTLEHHSIRDFEQNPIWETVGMVPEFWLINAYNVGGKFEGRETTTLETNVTVEIEIIGEEGKRPGYGSMAKLFSQRSP